MAYDYNKYMKEYREKNLVSVTLVLNKTKDKDILERIGTNNKSGKIKELIRKGLNNDNIRRNTEDKRN